MIEQFMILLLYLNIYFLILLGMIYELQSLLIGIIPSYFYAIIHYEFIFSSNNRNVFLFDAFYKLCYFICQSLLNFTTFSWTKCNNKDFKEFYLHGKNNVVVPGHECLKSSTPTKPSKFIVA